MRLQWDMQSDAIVPAIHARLAGALGLAAEAYVALTVDDVALGWIDDARAARLADFDGVFEVRDRVVSFRLDVASLEARTEALDAVARALSAQGLLSPWRNERYAVAPAFGQPPLFFLERAAARYFGVRTYAAHINGLVRQATRDAMWIARRSTRKAIDPGMLDNLVGGGIAAGMSVHATCIKEAWEEAGITAAIARQVQAAGAVHICRTQPDGLQRETIFVNDLWLDVDFAPENKDGEVQAFRLVPMADVVQLIVSDERGDALTADASLVIVDCLMRHGALLPDAAEYLALEALRHPALDPA
jgi:8-oxo-dGTP pyrophosphatase MutT (NUDIX family)